MTEQTFTIRAATADDLNEICRLYDKLNEHLDETVNNCGWEKGVYPVREIAEAGLKENALFVLITEGRIGATVILNSQQPGPYKDADWTPFADEEILVVHTLAVHPDFLRKGLARALLLFAEDLSRQKEMKAIRLDTYEHNDQAVALYKKLGYEDVGLVDLKMDQYERTKGWMFTCFEKLV